MTKLRAFAVFGVAVLSAVVAVMDAVDAGAAVREICK